MHLIPAPVPQVKNAPDPGNRRKGLYPDQGVPAPVWYWSIQFDSRHQRKDVILRWAYDAREA